MHVALCAIGNHYALLLALSVLLSATYFSLVSKQRRRTHAQQLSIVFPFLPRGRRTSTSKTPPRSVSPETKVPNNGPPPVDYKNILPPSQRETLTNVTESYASRDQERLLGDEIDEDVVKKNIIPFEADYRECRPSTYTCMGFSMEEVRKLGDFPDYSKLSGFPLPDAYKEFNIETAVARPYRPFRWAYHQTMCIFPSLTACSPHADIPSSLDQTRIRLVA